jgi:diguanylate cyclase (GGDEF)-like protein
VFGFVSGWMLDDRKRSFATPPARALPTRFPATSMTTTGQPGERQLSAVLSEFARTMVTDFPIEAILDHLVERIVEILPISAAGVTLIDAGSDPRYIAASDDSALRFEKLQTELGEGPCLLAYTSGEAVQVPDLRTETRFPRFAPRAIEAGMMAVFTFPLYHGDRRLGALDLYRETPGELTPESLAAAQTLADVVAAYLLNAQAREDLQDSSDRSRQASLHDSLTGLPNRVLLLERLVHALQRSRRTNRATGVYFIDLDLFKAVNDTHGHDIGDELLVAVARLLSGILRPPDTLARLAGDEYVALCEDLTDPDHAAAIGARMTAALNRPFALTGVAVTVTASIGIAYAEEGDPRTSEQLLHDADMAMYQAKHKGGARQQLFDLREQRLADRQAQAVTPAVPAHRGCRRRADHRIRGAPAVASPDPGNDSADHAHPLGGAVVPDHRNRGMGTPPGMGGPERLAKWRWPRRSGGRGQRVGAPADVLGFHRCRGGRPEHRRHRSCSAHPGDHRKRVHPGQ